MILKINNLQTEIKHFINKNTIRNEEIFISGCMLNQLIKKFCNSLFNKNALLMVLNNMEKTKQIYQLRTYEWVLK